MASEIGGDVPAALKLIDLTVVLRENELILLLALLHVNKSVAGASHENGRCTLVEGVVRNLEVAQLAIKVALEANACLGHELFALPVPQEHLPVRVACQRHDVAFLLRAEGGGDELL